MQCTGQLRTVTAALLTARFPYVTPSGVVDCPGPDGVLPSGDDVTTQIVDGGYAENTGVGTLLDLMPRVLADVRRHNSCVLSADPRAGSAPVSPRPTPSSCRSSSTSTTAPGRTWSAAPRGVTLEALVPPITLLQAKGALYSARAQLERAHAMLATDQLWSSSTELGAGRGPGGRRVARQPGRRRLPGDDARHRRAAGLGAVGGQHRRDGRRAVRAGAGRGPRVRCRPRYSPTRARTTVPTSSRPTRRPGSARSTTCSSCCPVGQVAATADGPDPDPDARGATGRCARRGRP